MKSSNKSRVFGLGVAIFGFLSNSILKLPSGFPSSGFCVFIQYLNVLKVEVPVCIHIVIFGHPTSSLAQITTCLSQLNNEILQVDTYMYSLLFTKKQEETFIMENICNLCVIHERYGCLFKCSALENDLLQNSHL